jgi:hypothetical protein
MTEERTEQHHYSEPDIAEILDELIDATQQVAASKRAVDEYRDNKKRPAMPDSNVFEDTERLAEYVNALADYDQGLTFALLKQTTSETRLEEQEGKVRTFLPRNSHVFHYYAMQQKRPRGRVGRYRITHYPGGAIEVSEGAD